MKLKQLIKGLEIGEVRGSRELTLTGISADSRTVAPGNLFIAKRGSQFDGSQFIGEALLAGAVAVVTDFYDPFLQATQVIHPDVSSVMGKLASRFYGEPSKELFVVGVTGTKGKTTTSYLIKHLLDGLGKKSGLVGTVETMVGDHRFFSTLTTPDAIANQKLLREMVIKGCKAAVLEVSSHGLQQGRVDEIDFDVGVFTNLYPDHLDYHGTIEEYAGAKKKLFERVKEKAVLNGDSDWSAYMRAGCKAPIVTFGIGGELQLDQLTFHSKGSEFRVSSRGEVCRFTTRLMGRFNVYNMLGAIGVGQHLGANLLEIAAILEKFESVPGRLEQIYSEKGPQVFVDYAHTGEALENVLRTLREISPQKLIVVFGCGGGRDPGRRKAMAQAAEKWADLSIITTDNPRHEDPSEICRQIVEGFTHLEKVVVELDRKRAIQAAIQRAESEDIVLIAGKGHERVQIFSHRSIPFDDRDIAKEALQNGSNSAILAP